MSEIEREIRELTPEWVNRRALKSLDGTRYHRENLLSGIRAARRNQQVSSGRLRADAEPSGSRVPAEVDAILDSIEIALGTIETQITKAKQILTQEFTPTMQAEREQVLVLWKAKMRQEKGKYGRRDLVRTGEWTPIVASNDPEKLRSIYTSWRADYKLLPEGEDPNVKAEE